MLFNKNNYVFILKGISLAIRSLVILFLYSQSLFEFLGFYSLVTSLSVIFTGLVGLEMHMITNREISSKKTKIKWFFPLYKHSYLILLITILSSFLCYFLSEKWSGVLILMGSFYVLGEYIRLFNFNGRIVLSAYLNLIRDILVVFSFCGLYFFPQSFIPISSLQILLILYLFYKSNNFRFIKFKEWYFQTLSLFKSSKFFYLNVITRNLLAYADRFLVLSVSGFDGLGKYSLLAYVNMSAITLLNGTIIYVRIPLMLRGVLSSFKFFIESLTKSIFVLVLIWVVFYVLYPYLNLSTEPLDLNSIKIFFMYGSSMLFFGVLGQILYNYKYDKYLVLTSVLAAFLTLLSAVVNQDVYLHLIYTSLGLIFLGFFRYLKIKKT